MTAYEMRISDWSSDVCSSDLTIAQRSDSSSSECRRVSQRLVDGRIICRDTRIAVGEIAGGLQPCAARVDHVQKVGRSAPVTGGHQVERVVGRSEEHTSELQSLMRLSYAVFFLKKKKIN